MNPWSRRREVAYGYLRSSPKPELKNKKMSYIEEGSIFFFVCFLHTSRRYTFDLDIDSTRGQPASCRAKPVNLDHLENSTWIHDLGGERLPAVSCALFAQT